MKKSLYITICLLLYFSLSVGNIMASPVEVKILSSNFHVWGSADFSSRYDISSTVPLIGYHYRHDYNSTDYSQFWYFDTVSSADFFNAHAFADLKTLTSGPREGAAVAESDWTFRPLYNGTYDLGFYYRTFYGAASASLTDVTTETSLWGVSTGIDPSYWVNGNFQVVFSSDHVYELSLFALGGSSEQDPGEGHIEIEGLQTVPEPATMLLLVLGLIGLAGVRRKFQK